MAGKELDPARKQAALDVVKQHPGMIAAMAAPAVIVVAVAWFVGGAGLGLLLLVAFGLLLLVAFGVLGAVGVSRLLRQR